MTELASYNIVGHATPRAEGPDKVTGIGKYGMDRAMEGMLWCKILRSPFAHARIVSIDTTEAANMPGVHMVLTGKDMVGVRTNRSTYKDEPALCWDTVLYVGDKVAAVVADDEDIAERTLGLIQVEYEELAPVLTAREAAQPDATILHPDFANYVGVGDAPETPTNILVTLNRGRGDVEAGFADADVIVEERYTTPHQHQAYLEPHSVLVDVEDDGTLQIWMSCQLPAANVGELLRVLDLPPEKVVINTSYVGGSFGGKTDATGVYIMQEFSKRTGRPIKLVFDYSEELMASNPRHPSEIHIQGGRQARRDDNGVAGGGVHGRRGVRILRSHSEWPARGFRDGRGVSVRQRRDDHYAHVRQPGAVRIRASAGDAAGAMGRRVAYRSVRTGYRHGTGGVSDAKHCA